MNKIYERVEFEKMEKEMMDSIAKEKNFWKKLGKIIALSSMLRSAY